MLECSDILPSKEWLRVETNIMCLAQISQLKRSLSHFKNFYLLQRLESWSEQSPPLALTGRLGVGNQAPESLASSTVMNCG